MEKSTHILVSALNISASPHPAEIYEKLLIYASDFEVSIGGSDFAQLTTPEYRINDRNIVHGRISVWTPIYREGDWYDRQTRDKATAEQKRLISIPPNIEPNYRFFYYAFDIKRHLLIFETRNSDGQTFSASRCERFFEILFDDLPDSFRVEAVAVHVMPEAGTVETILSLPRLRHLKILVTRPNNEDLSSEYAAVMEKMQNEKTKTYTVELTKAPKVERIEPDQNTQSLARIGGNGNGYVEGAETGEPAISTQDRPKRVPVDVPESESVFVRFLSSLSLF